MAVAVEIPKTMKAATTVEYNQKIVIRDDVPVPEVTPGKILVRVEAASLCSTDLLAYKGHMGPASKLPYIGGHEPAGTVVQLGANVKGFSVGDRVGFLPSRAPCNNCAECSLGNQHYCPTRSIHGMNQMYGGFSEYTLADPELTVKIPDALSFDAAAPLFCAGITSYSALLKVTSLPGQLVNIIGVGGVGHVAVMFAKAMGYRVTAYDIAEDKLEQAKACGADEVINFKDAKLSECEKAPSTLVISGAIQAYDNALLLTALHGTIVTIGLPSTPWSLNIQRLCALDITIRPTQTGGKREMTECLDLAARKNIRPIYKVRDIEQINEGFKELAEGKVEGRLVFHIR